MVINVEELQEIEQSVKRANYGGSRAPHLRSIAHWKQHLCSRKLLKGICHGSSGEYQVGAPEGGERGAGTHAWGYGGMAECRASERHVPVLSVRSKAEAWNGCERTVPAVGDTDVSVGQEARRRVTGGSRTTRAAARRFWRGERWSSNGTDWDNLTDSGSYSSFTSVSAVPSSKATVWGEQSWACVCEMVSAFPERDQLARFGRWTISTW